MVGQHPNQQSDQHDVIPIPESHTGSDDRIQSREYQQREDIGRRKDEEWMTDHAKLALHLLSNNQDDYIATLG